jgi:hypothetical protein
LCISATAAVSGFHAEGRTADEESSKQTEAFGTNGGMEMSTLLLGLATSVACTAFFLVMYLVQGKQ